MDWWCGGGGTEALSQIMEMERHVALNDDSIFPLLMLSHLTHQFSKIEAARGGSIPVDSTQLIGRQLSLS